MSQEQRDRVLARVRAATADLLIATDVAARGLDIDQLSHVVNYDVPSSPEAYVHRIGRVGRAGRDGVAITLAEPREHRMLKTIERVTKQPIGVEKLPTVADLRTRRLELTSAALREQLLGDDLDGFRVVVESLADEFDVVEVALAAVKLAYEATGASDDEEIPDVAPRPEREFPARFERRPSAERSSSYERGNFSRGDEHGRPERSGGRGAGRAPAMTRLFVGVGREAGIRPQDLVGAIAGETSLNGKQIGAIEIAPRFSLVEVPSASAEEVISALRGTTVKGRKATVRRERDAGRSR
jgi:ATP-dependent RNA helicase DeaD